MSKLKFNSNINNERDYTSKIPYSHHANETTIVTKEGEFLSTLKIAGKSFIGHSYETILRWIEELHTGWKGVSSEHLTIHTHLIRKKVFEYPEKKFTNYFSNEFDKIYSKQFNGNDLLVNDLYITFIYRPIVSSVDNRLKSNKNLTISERKEQQELYLEELSKITNIFFGMFNKKGYQPILLSTYRKTVKNEDLGIEQEYIFCQHLEFFNYLLTKEDRAVSVRKTRISDYIGNHRIFFSAQGEFGEIRQATGKKEFFGILDIKEYPEISGGGHLNNLMKLPFEFILSQSFSALTKQASKGFLKQQLKMLRDSKDMAESQMIALTDAMDGIESGKFMMGNHYLSIKIFGEDLKQTAKNLNETYNAMTDREFIVTRSDLALEASFFSQLPANTKYAPRLAPITSHNFLAFNSMHNYMIGKPLKNPWGSAVCLMKTQSQSPLYFNFHSTSLHKDSRGKMALGHTGLFGQSGAGKTVLISVLLNYLNDREKRTKQFIFDKDQGLAVYVQAVNGIYYTVEENQPTGWNPLKTDNAEFIKDFIKSLIMSDNEGISYYDDKHITIATDILMRHPIEDRNLTVFSQSLPNVISDNDQDRPSVFARLRKWLRGEEYGYLFDNDEDTLDLKQSDVFGFDVGKYIENETLREPIMTYLMHRADEMIDGTPFALVFDEFWKMLEALVFQKLIKNGLKTVRKKNVICIFATQEPNDVLSHPLAPTLVTQLATLVLLENLKAEEEHYIKGLKLTYEQFEAVQKLEEGSREFIIQQAQQISHAKLALESKEFEPFLSVFSGNPESAELVKKIKRNIAIDKLQKVINSELSSQSDIQSAKTMHWSQVKIDCSEWLPIFWKQRSEVDSISNV